ncbi:MAG: hypothetical protein IPI77_23480 [Saprospiraceae bacterium]|nr:hypothetical protein [Saprospiraceae bacterium]
MLYNQSEPQSVEAMERIRNLATNKYHPYLSICQFICRCTIGCSLFIGQEYRCVFANPDNIVFASFESILQSCNQKISRFLRVKPDWYNGALAAYGADIYQWGTRQARKLPIFKIKKLQGLHWEMVTLRKKVYNLSRSKIGINIPTDFGSIQ